jgi:hypothetical protein
MVLAGPTVASDGRNGQRPPSLAIRAVARRNATRIIPSQFLLGSLIGPVLGRILGQTVGVVCVFSAHHHVVAAGRTCRLGSKVRSRQWRERQCDAKKAEGAQAQPLRRQTVLRHMIHGDD